MLKRTAPRRSLRNRIVTSLLGIMVAGATFVATMPADVHAAVTVNASEISGDDILFDSGMLSTYNELVLLQDVTINLDADCSYSALLLHDHNLTIQADPNHPGKKLTITYCSNTGSGNIILDGGTLIVATSNYGAYSFIDIQGDLIIHNGKCEVDGRITPRNFIVTGNDSYVSGKYLLASSIDISDGNLIFNTDQLNAIFTNNTGSTISITGGNITAITTQNYYNGIVALGDNSTITISGSDTVVTAQGPGGAIASNGALNISTDLPSGVTIGQYTDSIFTFYGLLRNGNPITSRIVLGAASNAETTVPAIQGSTSSANPASAPSSSPNHATQHTHSYSWQTIIAPSAYSDGVEAYICSICGDIAARNTLPAVGVFEAETANSIKNAPKNGTVDIETKTWNSFGRGVRDALKERPDVTLKISFLSEGHKGVPLRLTIPAGTDIDSLYDDNGYMGLCRVGTTLGYDQ